MIRAVACAFIFLLCTYIGFLKSDELHKRVLFLENYYFALSKIKNTISFETKPTIDLIREIKGSESYDKYRYFENVHKNLDNRNLKAAFVLETEKYRKSHSLTQEDVNVINKFTDEFGNGDISATLSLCEYTQNCLSENIKNAKDIESKKSKIYKVLGSFAGTVIVVFIL